MEVVVQNLVKCMQETNEQAKNYKEGRNSWKKISQSIPGTHGFENRMGM